MQLVQPLLQSRIRSTKDKLAENGFAPTKAPTNRPDATAVYFGGVRRGPKGAFRYLLLADHSLPRWALLGISFVGEGIAEIVTHRPLANRLVAVMRLLFYKHLWQYKPHDSHPSGHEGTECHKNSQPTKAILACARRWPTEIDTSRSPASRDWYRSSIDRLTLQFPKLKSSLQDIEARKLPSNGNGVPGTPKVPRRKDSTRQPQGVTQLESTKSGVNASVKTTLNGMQQPQTPLQDARDSATDQRPLKRVLIGTDLN